MKLAPHIRSLVGIDVSDLVLAEARQLLEANQISNVSVVRGLADELTRYFGQEVFDKVISIDVYEHLHPEDAILHLFEVYSVLKPKGRFIVVTPNRFTGPHDITQDLFPDARQPLGFHLNETTCRELVSHMREVGFVRFRSALLISSVVPVSYDMLYPSALFMLFEGQFPKVRRRSFMYGFVNRLSGIFLIAEKP